MKRKVAFVMAMIMAVSAPAGIVGANESVSEERLSSLNVAEEEMKETSGDSAEIAIEDIEVSENLAKTVAETETIEFLTDITDVIFVADETEVSETESVMETKITEAESETEVAGGILEAADAETVVETEMEIGEADGIAVIGESQENESESGKLEVQTEYETAEEDGAMAVAADYTSGYWTYTVSGSSATITGYSGSSTSVTIPSSVGGYTVTKIGSSAFEDSTMTNLVIPETITEIGKCAFKNCKYLTSITINAQNLSNLSSNSASSSSYKSYSVFYNAGAESGSISVTFGNSVKNIPAYLFAVGSDKSIGTYARITSLTISNSVTSIGDGAFENCYDLKNVTWGSGITSIGGWAFEDTAITSVTIPSGTTSIGRAAFSNCTKLTSITINAQNISDLSSNSTSSSSYKSYSAFYNAGADSSSLSVTFGSTVKKIPAYLFATAADYSYGSGTYAHITSVTIPSSVTSIGKYAFYKCYDLKTVKISGTNTTFGDHAFGSCSASLTFSCYSGSTAATYASANGYKTSYLSTALSKPTISKAKNTSKGIKLTWKKISNASGYYIYRKSSSGSYKKIATISSASTVSYTDTAVKNKNGTKYTYKVVAYNGTTTSSGATKTTYRLKAVSLSSAANSSSGKIAVNWSSTTKVTGYQIQYSTSSSFSSGNKTVKVSGATSKSYTLTGLAVGTTYYVRIRTYKTVNGKTYYSAWGSKKAVKVSK